MTTTNAAPIAPLSFNLFDHTPATDNISYIRPATDAECEAYLRDVGRRAGLPCEGRVSLVASQSRRGRGGDRVIYGMTVAAGDVSYSIPMPGRNQSQTVVMETLDDAGEVVAVQRSAVTYNGKLELSREAVRKAVGPVARVRAVRRPRAAAAPVAAPVVTATDAAAAMAPGGAWDAPEAVAAPEPAAVPAADVAELLARLVALEATVSRLTRPAGRVRSEAERRAIVRAWRHRCEARARADLDRRALEAANGAYRGALDAIAHRTAEATSLRAEVAMLTDQIANARRSAIDWRAEAERAVASLDRTAARRRATAAALMTARRRTVTARADAFQAGRRASQAEIALAGAQMASAAAWERVAALQIDRAAVAA